MNEKIKDKIENTRNTLNNKIDSVKVLIDTLSCLEDINKDIISFIDSVYSESWYFRKEVSISWQFNISVTLEVKNRVLYVDIQKQNNQFLGRHGIYYRFFRTFKNGNKRPISHGYENTNGIIKFINEMMESLKDDN